MKKFFCALLLNFSLILKLNAIESIKSTYQKFKESSKSTETVVITATGITTAILLYKLFYNNTNLSKQNRELQGQLNGTNNLIDKYDDMYDKVSKLQTKRTFFKAWKKLFIKKRKDIAKDKDKNSLIRSSYVQHWIP